MAKRSARKTTKKQIAIVSLQQRHGQLDVHIEEILAMRNYPIEEIKPKEAANEKQNSFVGILETPQIPTASAAFDVSIECFVALLVGENPVHSLVEATCLGRAKVVADNGMVLLLLLLLVCIALLEF